MAKNKNPNSIIFQTVDPQNRISSYTQKCKQHVFSERKDSISRLGNLGIKKTIESPEYITEDKDFDTTKNYYRPHETECLNIYGTHVKVAVDYGQSEQYGFVKTVYIIEKNKNYPNSKDKIIWKR